MKEVDKKILARIQKMLALAKDQAASPQEAATAAAMAANLMRKHGIEHADDIKVALKSDDELSAEFITEQFDHTAARYPGWLNILATATAKHFDCESRLEPVWDRTREAGRFTKSPYVSIKLYGYGPDVTVARWTVSYLVGAVQSSVDVWWDTKRSASTQHHARQMKQDYRLGMVLELVERLKRMVEVQESTSRGLVVVKHAAVERKYGSFNYNKTDTMVQEHDAFSAGAAAGRKLPINKPIEGGAAGEAPKQLATN